jgi:hypothetical protein
MLAKNTEDIVATTYYYSFEGLRQETATMMATTDKKCNSHDLSKTAIPGSEFLAAICHSHSHSSILLAATTASSSCCHLPQIFLLTQ